DDAGGVAFLGTLASGDWLFRAEAGGVTALAPVGRRAEGFTSALENWRRIAWVRDGAVEGLDGTVRTLVPTKVSVPARGFRPSHVDASARGDFVLLAERSALYRLRGGVADVAAEDGSVLPGTGVASIVEAAPDFRFVGDELLVLVPLETGGRALARSTAGGLVPLIVTGNPTPLGGTFQLEYDTLARSDATNDALLFVASIDTHAGPALFRLDPLTGAVEGLLRGLQATSLVPGGGDVPVVAATLDDGRSALLLVDPRRTRVIAASGHRFASIEAAAINSRRTLFRGFIRRGNEVKDGLFARSRERRALTRRLLSRGTPAPGGGAVTDVVPDIEVRGAGLGIVIDHANAVLALRGRRLVPMLRVGDRICGDGQDVVSALEVAWVGDRRAVALGYVEQPHG
ncbi:MAG: hypothetical protein ACREKH_14380, partial [Candidatus Rokuibacteriota bacterium]